MHLPEEGVGFQAFRSFVTVKTFEFHSRPSRRKTEVNGIVVVMATVIYFAAGSQILMRTLRVLLSSECWNEKRWCHFQNGKMVRVETHHGI